jgi:hypothetical protein
MAPRDSGPGEIASPQGRLNDNATAKQLMSAVTVAPDAVLTEQWLRANGYRLAADERARTMRLASIALDRLLKVPCCGRDAA